MFSLDFIIFLSLDLKNPLSKLATISEIALKHKKPMQTIIKNAHSKIALNCSSTSCI